MAIWTADNAVATADGAPANYEGYWGYFPMSNVWTADGLIAQVGPNLGGPEAQTNDARSRFYWPGTSNTHRTPVNIVLGSTVFP